MSERCCCGKRKLEDGEPIVINRYVHEVIGPENFCGPLISHELRDTQKKLDAAVEALKFYADEKNWCPLQDGFVMAPISQDLGSRARQVMQEG